MSTCAVIDITLELLSDTIFGSGLNTPGGEDISVNIDQDGYPYLNGSTLKGLLRESAENLCAWGEADSAILNVLFGDEGWNAVADERRLRFTSLTLLERPSDPARCFDTRMFTSLENGLAKKGSLRMASCVREGMTFCGKLICATQDVPFMKLALQGIHHLGTLRNRGFGHVRFSSTERREDASIMSQNESTCIGYELFLSLPVQTTDAQRSNDNSFETRPYIAGSAVRGMVMSRLSQREPDWFEEHKLTLLSDRVRFLDAIPMPARANHTAAIPSPAGFYEDALEDGLELSLTNDYNFEAKKRAELGTFCELDNDTICYWSPKTGGAIRIHRGTSTEDSQVFQTGYLYAGQTLKGYIVLDDPSLAPKIRECFAQSVWLGADRYEGFGKCEATCSDAKCPAWIDAYGITEDEPIGNTLYLLLISPTALVDQTGAPCAIGSELLSKWLQTAVTVADCSTSVSEYHSYNRTWQCQSPRVKMYERGSVFKLIFKTPPTWGAICALQQRGIGIRRAEGFGQILFLSKERFEHLAKKQKYDAKSRSYKLTDTVLLRRKRIVWVTEKAKKLQNSKLSASQIGDIQIKCEQAIAAGGNLNALYAFLDHNENRGAALKSKYKAVNDLVRQVMNLSNELPVQDSQSVIERLQLLCMLFDHQRKKGGH